MLGAAALAFIGPLSEFLRPLARATGEALAALAGYAWDGVVVIATRPSALFLTLALFGVGYSVALHEVTAARREQAVALAECVKIARATQSKAVAQREQSAWPF